MLRMVGNSSKRKAPMKAPTTTTEPAAVRPLPPLGCRLAVGKNHLFVHCSGDGGPAVVMLPGAGTVGLDYLNIHEGVARRSTSVLYDRAGTGWSETVDLPRTCAQITTELRDLLVAARILAPYVLVGHSLGGAYARHYAQRWPSEVAGLLLIDPLHEDSAKYWPDEVVNSQQQMRESPMTELPDALIELYRRAFEERFQSWPAAVREPLVAYHLEAWRTGILEAMNTETVCEELRHGGRLHDVPLIVLTAMGLDPVQQAFVPDAVQQQVNEGKRIVNELIAQSVPRGRHVVVNDAAHAWITMDQGAAVLQYIYELLDAAHG
jgi:pimeloyl-ACP methyl ester carboxylesterase